MEIFRFVFSPIDENTYLLADSSGDCAIIDCGCYDESESAELESFIRDKNLNPVLLLNTHCHLDHIFGNKFILDRYKLRTHCSDKEEMNRNSALQHASLFGLTMDMPPEPGKFISDNDVVTFGTTELRAIHVPGHSPGTLAFYSEINACVFTGDALFAGSIGRTDLPGGDFETLTDSIKNKLFVLPPSTIVYAGHGGETTIGKEMKSNPWFNMT
jgi:glyoxylase-like metal-dependent hydrolase (beta-lactamase superfamily II)